jgi:hypothetical protein
MNIKKRPGPGPGPVKKLPGPGPGPLRKATGTRIGTVTETGTTEKKLTGPGPKNLGPAHYYSGVDTSNRNLRQSVFVHFLD